MAAACAAGVLGPLAASATPFLESSIGDFGDDLATRTELPAGTDVVEGTVFNETVVDPPNIDLLDFFAFSDLVPGEAFSILFETTNSDYQSNYQVSDQLGNLLAPEIDLEMGEIAQRGGTVPASGTVVVRVEVGGDIGGYRVSLVPEPATALLVGGGVMVVLSWQRRCNRPR